MNLIKLISIPVLMVLLSLSTDAQNIGYRLPDGAKKVRIPFEVHNNLIVLPIIINGQTKLKFILDTGVQYPILTEKYFGSMIGLQYTRKIVIQGTGSIDSLSALVATNVSLELPNGVKSGLNQSLLVLEEDYLNLKENMGVDIYGIIGYDIFSRFIVEIDYDNKYLVLHEPETFRPKRRYELLDLTVRDTKPFINLNVINEDNENFELLFMIDTGASHTLLMNDSENKLHPSTTVPSVIGRGLGGDIRGDLGRVDLVKIGKYSCVQPIISFPQEGDYGSPITRGSRNGTVGSGLLSRFDVIFDYFSGHIYIKRNRNFSRPYEYDMSGLTLSLDSQNYDRFKVNHVRDNSPAYLSGIKKGDIIESINGYIFEDLKLTGANEILRQREGKKITIKVIRGKEHFKASFNLKRYI